MDHGIEMFPTEQDNVDVTDNSSSDNSTSYRFVNNVKRTDFLKEHETKIALGPMSNAHRAEVRSAISHWVVLIGYKKDSGVQCTNNSPSGYQVLSTLYPGCVKWSLSG